MERIEIGAFSLAELHADAADRLWHGAAFRARISRMIGTGVRNNAEHRANRIGDASGYKKGTVRKHANDRI
jgi:hypothetical protein